MNPPCALQTISEFLPYFPFQNAGRHGITPRRLAKTSEANVTASSSYCLSTCRLLQSCFCMPGRLHSAHLLQELPCQSPHAFGGCLAAVGLRGADLLHGRQQPWTRMCGKLLHVKGCSLSKDSSIHRPHATQWCHVHLICGLAMNECCHICRISTGVVSTCQKQFLTSRYSGANMSSSPGLPA